CRTFGGRRVVERSQAGSLARMRFGVVKSIFQKVDTIVTGRGRIDEELFEDLEAALLQADVNVHTTLAALDELRAAVRENRLKEAGDVKAHLRESLSATLDKAGVEGGKLHVSDTPPTVHPVVGVQ